MVKSATESVIVTKVSSELTIGLSRTSGAPGDVDILGSLYKAGTIVVIPGATVDLWVNGLKVGSAMTNYSGRYLFEVTFEEGSYSIYTSWDGNDTYWQDASPPVEANYGKIVADFTGFSVSPSSGAPPLAVHIDGFLRRVDTSAPLEQKLIHCYRDGVEIASMKTSSLAGRRGEFWFSDTLTAPGGHNYYVEFEGDDQYAGCEEEESIALPCTICGHPIPVMALGSEVECEFCHSVFETVIV